MGGGVSTNHKSSNRIELSQLGQVLLNLLDLLDLFLMDVINTAQKRRKHVTHLTTGKKTRKRLHIADDSLGTAEKICQVSPLKVETKLLQMTEIEKKCIIFD